MSACRSVCAWLVLFGLAPAAGEESAPRAPSTWSIGTPIATYWAGPKLDDRAARQMAAGGFNLVWCGEGELDVARRHRLRAMLRDRLISPASLDDADRRRRLDALVERVREHPALYAYYVTDEPNAAEFPALGRLVAYLRERDPAHLAYINLFPTYASNKQLGTTGDVAAAYREHLERYVRTVKPALISYDHYQFRVKGESDQYFLNLAMIRRAALDAGVPFLNIVQACTWAPKSMRIPNPDELRYLVFTTAAYGAQGISYYVYSAPGHHGSIVGLDGTPGPLYRAVSSCNPEFVAIATELQPLRSLGVYHTSLREPGCEPLPAAAPFQIEKGSSPPRPRGFLLGLFGAGKTPTHAVVVNLDFTAATRTTAVGPGRLAVFDAARRKWVPAAGRRVELALPPGGGRLIRHGGGGG